MNRPKILVRTLFVFILLAGLVAGIFLSSRLAVKAAPQQLSSTNIVISQIYGGGGNSGATYKNDFIELFNLSSSPVDITGWSVQYASSTGSSWAQTNLFGMMQPGQYYLIQEAAGSGGTANLPTPNATGSIAMDANSGKVALVNNSTKLSALCPSGVIDFVGFGSSAKCYEGSGPAPTPSNTTADIRETNGCYDTNDNSADFTTGIPTPRNSLSLFNSCALPTATFTPTNTLTSTLTDTPTFTPTATLTSTSTPTNTPTHTPTSTVTTSPTITNTSTKTPTFTPTNTSTPIPTNTPTSTSTAYPHLSVMINEIAWAGTLASSSDEWMELYNSTGSNISLDGWQLISDDGSIAINLNGTIQANHYFLLERTDDTTVSDITADQIYTSSLSNSGTALRLLDPSGFLVDSANLSGGAWPAGNAKNFASMERLPNTLDSAFAWVTNDGSHRNGLDANRNPINGTPKNVTWEGVSVTLTPSPTPTSTPVVCPSTTYPPLSGPPAIT